MRFFGKIGYGESTETFLGSGTWVDDIHEVEYYGDVLRNVKKDVAGDNLNNDLTVMNSISIVADQYAFEHFFNIKYVEWENSFWTITSVEVKPPRLILSLGGVYNGSTP